MRCLFGARPPCGTPRFFPACFTPRLPFPSKFPLSVFLQYFPLTGQPSFISLAGFLVRPIGGNFISYACLQRVYLQLLVSGLPVKDPDDARWQCRWPSVIHPRYPHHVPMPPFLMVETYMSPRRTIVESTAVSGILHRRCPSATLFPSQCISRLNGF